MQIQDAYGLADPVTEAGSAGKTPMGDVGDGLSGKSNRHDLLN